MANTSSLSPRPPAKQHSMRRFYIGAAIVAGIAGVAGIAVAATAPKPKKKVNVGLKVKAQCSGYTITDPMRLRDALRKQIAITAKKTSPDPFTETSRFLKKYFKCTAYPNPARNPGEAELFAVVFKMVTEIMEQEMLTSADQRRTYDDMVDTWAASQGVGGKVEPDDDDIEIEEEPGGDAQS